MKIKSYVFVNKGFILFALSFFLAIFVIQHINDRFWLNDFKVYYLAAEALLNGDPVYGKAFGLATGFYKYSPFILFGFTPYCLVPYYFATVIHFIVISFATIAAIILLHQLFSNYLFKSTSPKSALVLCLGLIAILRHIVRELHMGNVNMMLVLLLSLGILSALRNKHLASGIFIGISIMIKPFFILLLLPFLLDKRILAVWYSCLTMLFSVCVPVFFLGLTTTIDYHREWLKSMIEHNTYISSNETIYSLIKFYLHHNMPDTIQYLIIVMVLFGCVGLYYYLKHTHTHNEPKSEANPTAWMISFFALLGIIPNLVSTDTEHFLYSMPIILMLLHYLVRSGRLHEVVLFVILIFVYAANSPDILGRELSYKLDTMGFLGISNLLLIVFFVIIGIRIKPGVRQQN